VYVGASGRLTEDSDAALDRTTQSGSRGSSRGTRNKLLGNHPKTARWR
jgi:hypothetical protein